MAFIIDKWGPKRLREIFEKIQNAINERTPLASETAEVNETPLGMQICFKTQGNASASDDGGAGGGGTNQDIYGSLNGAPAVFHLSRTRAPTVPPP